VNNGASIVGPNNISAISIDFPANFTSVVITVYATNACGNGGTRSLTVTSTPLIPGAITGSSSVCNGQVDFYGTSGSAGATAYTWTVPANAIILSGQNTANVAVLFGASSGNVTVRASNACGFSPIRSYAVSVTCREAQIKGSLENIATELYPNPTTGKTSIRFSRESDEMVSLRIFDIAGRVMKNENITTVKGLNVHEIDFSTFDKGLYMIELKGKEMSEMLKVTVE
jgi:hypothetical protein